MNRNRYSIWRDAAADCYEILRWNGSGHEIVQTHIYSREKARMALVMWRTREDIHNKLRQLAEMEAELLRSHLELKREYDAP